MKWIVQTLGLVERAALSRPDESVASTVGADTPAFATVYGAAVNLFDSRNMRDEYNRMAAATLDALMIFNKTDTKAWEVGDHAGTPAFCL
jgi:hypothetical protein